MLMIKRIPWVSLLLAFLTYSSFGWIIIKMQAPLVVWPVIVVAILFLVTGLTSPWSKIANYSAIFVKSDIRSFGSAILAAFIFFLMIAEFRIFLNFLVIFSATILIRIDFQAAGLEEGKSFWFISTFAVLSLALGAGLQLLSSHSLFG
jgi:hypothetical protein